MLILARRNLDTELQRDITRPDGADADAFARDLDEIAEFWASQPAKTRSGRLYQTPEKPQYPADKAEEREAAFERGVRSTERLLGCGVGGTYPQQPNQAQHQNRQYQPQQVRNQNWGPNRQRSFPAPQYQASYYATTGNDDYADGHEEPEGHEHEAYLAESNRNQSTCFSMIQLGAKRECHHSYANRRFSDSDQLRTHVLEHHGVDPRCSTYSNQMTQVIMNPPPAGGYAVVQAKYADESAQDLCVDTGSGVGLIDKKFAHEKGLRVMYTKPTYVKGVGNQTTNEYIVLPLQIGEARIHAQALVLRDLGAGATIGMDTIKGYGMDVLTSIDKLRIGDTEVPLT